MLSATSHTSVRTEIISWTLKEAMTPINAAVSRAHRLPHELHRLHEAASGVSLNDPWLKLRRFPITPLSSLGDDVIVIPAEWMPAGPSRSFGARNIRVLDMFPSGRPHRDCLYHEEQVRRTLFAFFMIPRRTERGVRS